MTFELSTRYDQKRWPSKKAIALTAWAFTDGKQRAVAVGDHGADVVDVVALGHAKLQHVLLDDAHDALAARADPHTGATVVDDGRDGGSSSVAFPLAFF
jgi:hypothetical protein